MLFDQLNKDLITSLKARDEIRTSVLRFLISEVKNFVIAHYPPGASGGLTDEDVTSVIRHLVKTHRESIAMFQKGGREDLVTKEQKELDILQSYLPKQLSEEEVRQIVKKVISSFGGDLDFGRVMGQSMKEVSGKADGKMVSQIVREEMGKTTHG